MPLNLSVKAEFLAFCPRPGVSLETSVISIVVTFPPLMPTIVEISPPYPVVSTEKA